jgi:hypothetical protein
MRLGCRYPISSVQSFRRCGAVLLEVVAALMLLLAAVSIITAALNASMSSVERLRLNTHAASLAVSVLSELQIGIRSIAVTGPQSFEEPFQDWTWELVSGEAGIDRKESSQIKSVEIVIRHEEPPVTYRLSEMIQIPDTAVADSAGASPGNSEL